MSRHRRQNHKGVCGKSQRDRHERCQPHAAPTALTNRSEKPVFGQGLNSAVLHYPSKTFSFIILDPSRRSNLGPLDLEKEVTIFELAQGLLIDMRHVCHGNDVEPRQCIHNTGPLLSIFAVTDKCVLGTHTCSSDATCANTLGSFTCTCKSGYFGGGHTCTSQYLL